MLTCVEPLFAALLAMILLGQFLSPTEWIGLFIVLLSIFMFEKHAPKTGKLHDSRAMANLGSLLLVFSLESSPVV